MSDQQHRLHVIGKDYRTPGIYYITIETNERKRLFGELNTDVRSPQVILSEFGRYVQEQWERMSAM